MEYTDLIIDKPQLVSPNPMQSIPMSVNEVSPMNGLSDLSQNQIPFAQSVKQPLAEQNLYKTTLNYVNASLSDATTMLDSGIQIASQDFSQACTLHILDNHSNIELNKDTPSSIKAKMGNTTAGFDTTTTQAKNENSLKENKNKEEEISSQVGENQTTSIVLEEKDSPSENTEQQKEQDLLANNKTEERRPSFKQLRVHTQQGLEASKGVSSDFKSDSEQNQETVVQHLSKDGIIGNKSQSKQNFTSDQNDSEDYNTSRVEGSSREESAPSGNEETKSKDNEVRKESGQKAKLSLLDFHKVTVIGRGSYGEVSLVKKLSSNKVYALKAIDKYFMKKEKKEHQVYVEKEVLMKSNHPNIIRFFSSFQDKKKLYFVLEYVGGGEFSDYLRIQRKLNREQISFYAAEIINILQYLHSSGIAHRDIKPENLLLTTDGHLKCIDFGTARFLNIDKRSSEAFPLKKSEEATEEHGDDDSSEELAHRKTFVGTAQYVSPEMLENSECGAAADLWALGCMIYLMAVGRYPFEDNNEFLIFQKIQNNTISYPENMDPEIKDLVQQLLVKDPMKRLGAGPKGSENDYSHLRAHPLFKGIDFARIHRHTAPPIDIVSPCRTKNQDVEGTDEIEGKIIPNRKKFLSEDLQSLEEKPVKPSQFANSERAESIILSGLVAKKCGWLFFRPRQLILNNKPRLSYFDPETNQIKGEVPLIESTVAEIESKGRWLIRTPKRNYYFKEMEHSAEKWVETINSIIAQVKDSDPNLPQ